MNKVKPHYKITILPDGIEGFWAVHRWTLENWWFRDCTQSVEYYSKDKPKVFGIRVSYNHRAYRICYRCGSKEGLSDGYCYKCKTLIEILGV